MTSTIKVNITGMGIQCRLEQSIIPAIDITTGTDSGGLQRECVYSSSSGNNNGITDCEFMCHCDIVACVSLHVLIRREAVIAVSAQIMDVEYIV